MDAEARIEVFLVNLNSLLRVGSRRSVMSDIQPRDRPLPARSRRFIVGQEALVA